MNNLPSMLCAQGNGILLILLLSVFSALCKAHYSVAAKDTCSKLYYNRPKCVDHPDGYGCECGPGFHWNTHRCMSSAVDSRLEFEQTKPVRYTVLRGKSFPSLKHFSIMFWLNTTNNRHSGTIFSYKHGKNVDMVRMVSGPKMSLQVWDDIYQTDIELQENRWYHVAWIWSSVDASWQLFLDGNLRESGYGLGHRVDIPDGGEFVLGQSSRTSVEFNPLQAFLGALAHFNVWNDMKNHSEIIAIFTDCTFMYCGNAVQWVEFRTGTRGAMRLRWPSGVLVRACYDSEEMALTCDKYCSNEIGAQCNEEITDNIKWSRTKADRNISVPCPGRRRRQDRNLTSVDSAIRTCRRTSDNDGKWDDPILDACISESLSDLKHEFETTFRAQRLEAVSILELADLLLNHTIANTYANPIDVATVIKLLEMLVNTQGVTMRVVTYTHGPRKYARTQAFYPTLSQTAVFAKLIADIVDNLLDRKNAVAWNATRPLGAEGDSLMLVMRNFSAVVSKSLEYYVKDGLLVNHEAVIKVSRPAIAFKITSQWVEDFQSVRFPDMQDIKELDMREEEGYLHLQGDVIRSQNATGIPVFIGVSCFYYANLSWIVPKEHVKRKRMEDNVNSPVVALYLHGEEGATDIYNLTEPIIIDLPFVDTFNISNPECIRMRHRSIYRSRSSHWKWQGSGCHLIRQHRNRAICACSVPGVFALTTDMYNDNWDKGDHRPKLMNIASYVGCSVSILLCLITFAMLTYLRTTSSTAALHKNLALAILCSQVCFMVGIDRYDNPVPCQVFAVLLHYFVLATFSWIMNEAFNLYILITYSALSHAETTDSGSQLRFYILGWVIPGVLVGAFVGSQSDGYYAPDMCWIAYDHIWLFIGPIIGIISVTILILIFTAKEHNENSYTKTEKTNKVITIHMKALWTQVILLTICWAFAFLTVKMTDPLIKFLYAIFNSLQGAFFIVFYFLLHEEVRSVIKSEQKKKTLTIHGLDYPGDGMSMESFGSYNVMFDKDVTREGIQLESKQHLKPRTLTKRKLRSQIEASSDEASDCEMMVTSV